MTEKQPPPASELTNPSISDHVVDNPQSQFTKKQKISLFLNNIMTLISGLAFSLFNPILFDYISSMDVSSHFYSELGLAYGLSAVASNAFVAFYGSKSWFPRFKVVYLTTLALNAIAGLLFATVENPYLVLSTKILTGIASCAQASTKVYVSAMTDQSNRARYQNILTTFTFIANFIAPLLVLIFEFVHVDTFLPFNKFTLPGWFICISCAVCFVVTLLCFEEPPVNQNQRMPASKTLSNASSTTSSLDTEPQKHSIFYQFPWIVFAMTCYGRFLQYFGDAVFQTAAPLVLSQDLGITNTLQVDYVFLLYGLCYFVSTLPMTLVIAKFGFRKVLITGSSVLSLALLLVIRFYTGTDDGHGVKFWAYLVQFCIGAMCTAVGCVFIAQASSSLLSICVPRQEQQSFAMGAYIVTGFVGRLVGCYWGGLAKFVGGLNTIFIGSLAVAMVGFFMFVAAYRKLDETIYSKKQ